MFKIIYLCSLTMRGVLPSADDLYLTYNEGDCRDYYNTRRSTYVMAGTHKYVMPYDLYILEKFCGKDLKGCPFL